MKRRAKQKAPRARKGAAPRERKRKADPQYLTRPFRFMLRFNKAEYREFLKRAKDSGLSRVEYGRRKILDRPVVDITRPATPQAPDHAREQQPA